MDPISDISNIIIRNTHREKIWISTTNNYEDYLRTIKCGKCCYDKYLMLALFKEDNG